MGIPFDSRVVARDRVQTVAAMFKDALVTLRAAGEELRTVAGTDDDLRELYGVRSRLDQLTRALSAPGRLASIDLELVALPAAQAAHNAAEAAHEQLSRAEGSNAR
ncbi:hypothetical protein [Myxococcus stipitatus]|uniref:hypothetical protein n=1 Tax=Myxococcus stipitatus TaxID=83455 RepID=UPI0030CF584D